MDVTQPHHDAWIDAATLAGLAATATAVVAFLGLLYRIPWTLGV